MLFGLCLFGSCVPCSLPGGSKKVPHFTHHIMPFVLMVGDLVRDVFDWLFSGFQVMACLIDHSHVIVSEYGSWMTVFIYIFFFLPSAFFQ